MKQFFTILLVCIVLQAFPQFDNYFLPKTLRLDYFHSGNATEEIYSFDELIEEPYWGGSLVNMIDTFGFGQYFVKVIDKQSGSLIYSSGYSSLFSEWQTTAEAQKTWRTYSESIVMPYPKNDVDVEIWSRDRKGIFTKKFTYPVQIKDYFINKQQRSIYPAFDVLNSGDPSIKVDIVIIPEGYTESEMELFKADCRKFADEMFSFSPYSEFKNKFNIRGILAPSVESGTDIPADGIWKNTVVNSRFYTFDLERYCMTSDFKSLRDVAANAPYDQIYVLINSSKYGGGAIYNHYSMSVNSNKAAGKIFIHEFGHGFAGLGDEYYNSAVAYNDFYPAGVEPWEPNITTLIDFERKWKDMIPENTPIPTPDDEKYRSQTGVFEGGGYASKGIYRPRVDCMMNTFNGNIFCDPCVRAIRKMIDFYCK
jgi:hypothetical protein